LAGGLFVLPKMHKITQNSLLKKYGIFCLTFSIWLLGAFHNDKSADHGFLGEAPPPGCCPGQREVQATEKLVVKHGGALGCEQRHILDDFLSVDSGQPLSGWFSLKSILPKRGSAFYTI